MLEFLKSFFGQGGERSSEAPELRLRLEDRNGNEQELKYHYNLGYRQINEAVKSKIKQIRIKIEKTCSSNKASISDPDQIDSGSRSAPEAESSTGIISLFSPLGSDSSLVDVNPDDNGSIIAQSLCSNLYKEALIKNNYLDF